MYFFMIGVADSMFKELHSKEVVGVQRGIRQFSLYLESKLGNNSESASQADGAGGKKGKKNKIKKWKPKL